MTAHNLHKPVRLETKQLEVITCIGLHTPFFRDGDIAMYKLTIFNQPNLAFPKPSRLKHDSQTWICLVRSGVK